MILLIELNVEGVPNGVHPHEIAAAIGFDPAQDATFFTLPEGVEGIEHTAPTWQVASATVKQ